MSAGALGVGWRDVDVDVGDRFFALILATALCAL